MVGPSLALIGCASGGGARWIAVSEWPPGELGVKRACVHLIAIQPNGAEQVLKPPADASVFGSSLCGVTPSRRTGALPRLVVGDMGGDYGGPGSAWLVNRVEQAD